ncbi:hypothetical protein [Borreliella garinii]|nr:hypothetical protein [Borreliella garinii]
MQKERDSYGSLSFFMFNSFKLKTFLKKAHQKVFLKIASIAF